MSRRLAAFAALLLAVVSGILPGSARALPVTRNLTFQAQKNDYAPAPGGQNYSACWSYIHSNGDEYAIIGVNGLTSTTGGTAIYNVTNPAAPSLVGFISGPSSIWREMKSYRDWIYVVTEGTGPGQGLQIIRMTNPEAPVLVATYTTNFFRSHTVSVDTTRGLLVCNGTTGPSGGTGMRILALNNPGISATPETPVEIAWWPGGAIPISGTDYIHDSVPIGNRLYASSIYPGIQRVLDITNPAAPTQLAAWNYPGGFTHNAWPDATGNFLYVTDEVKGQPLKIFDISNLAAPTLENAITSNPQAIVHNAHVRGDKLYLANYTEGIRALDLSDPCHPAEFGWADSYPGPSGGFAGVWAVCPFFPSGTVIASDRNSGLYVYREVQDYGILRAEVVNGGTEPAAHACGTAPGSCCCAPGPCTCGATALPGGPFPDVEVFVTTQGDSLVTPADGIVQFAPSPGSHTVLARRFGYYDASETRTVSVGSSETVTLSLVPKPAVQFTGTVRDASNGNPLEGAEVNLAYTHVHQHTGPSGVYSLSIPDDMYLLQVRRGGYVPFVIERRIGPGFPGQDYSLPPAAVWDPLEVVGSWVIGAAGDNAFQGVWTRVAPLGTGPRPPAAPPPGALAREEIGWGVLASAAAAWMVPARSGLSPDATAAPPDAVGAGRGRGGATPLDAQHEGEESGPAPNMAPYTDHTPGTGTMCYVTGQGTDSTNVYNGDLSGGKTTLTTAALDASGMAVPTIGFWRWFASHHPIGVSSGHDGPDPSDYLAVLISNDNGANWTVVDTTRGLANHWTERTIRVADYVTPTAQVKLRFVAAAGGTNAFISTEAGIDDLTLYDAPTNTIEAPPPAGVRRLSFRAPWPNPGSGAVRFVLDLPTAAEVAVDVLDLAGRRVAALHAGAAGPGPLTLAWDGRDANGREAPAGLYFARAAAGNEHAIARFLRIR